MVKFKGVSYIMAMVQSHIKEHYFIGALYSHWHRFTYDVSRFRTWIGIFTYAHTSATFRIFVDIPYAFAGGRNYANVEFNDDRYATCFSRNALNGI